MNFPVNKLVLPAHIFNKNPAKYSGYKLFIVNSVKSLKFYQKSSRGVKHFLYFFQVTVFVFSASK